MLAVTTMVCGIMEMTNFSRPFLPTESGSSRVPIIIFIAITMLSGLLFFLYTQPALGKKGAEEAAKIKAATAKSQPTEAGESSGGTPTGKAPAVVATPKGPASPDSQGGAEKPAPQVTQTPAAVVEDLAKGFLAGKAGKVLLGLGPGLIDDARIGELQKLIDQGFEIDPENAVSEIGRTPGLQRWALNLRKKDAPDSTLRVELDFARQADAGALNAAFSFVEAVQKLDFATARRFVDQDRVNDATIAGLCIIFEEGGFVLKKERPLIATVARENVAWFLAQVTSESLETESRFGLVLQRDKGLPWRITEINPERILSVYASRFGDGDVYYTPLVRNPKGGDSVVLYFSYAAADIHPRTLRQIKIIAGMLKANPVRKLRIWGHTDARGTSEYNKELSVKRAESVRAAIIDAGVPPEQVEVAGFGATRPRRANFNPDGTDNPAGRKVNRRAEIYLDF